MSFLRVASCTVILATLPYAREARPDAGTEAAPDSTLQSAVATMMNSLKGASIGASIVDVASGRILAASKEHVLLNPASNAKLYTAAAALSNLHADHRYETTVSGSIKSGAATSITIRGFGDPSLSSDDLMAMSQDLRDQGLRRIDGDILVEQAFFDDQTTPPAFEQKPGEWAAFRAPISAVAVNENTVTLTVKPTTTGETAHAWFDPPGFVDVEGSVTTGDVGADTVVLGLAPNAHRMSAKLSGSVGSDARLVRYTRRVEDPTLLAGYVLKTQLERIGIKISGDVKSGSGKGNVLVRHTSAPLSSLLYALGKDSNNFYAEMIFKSMGGESKGKPAKSADGAELVQKILTLAGANDAGVVIKNGSGLYDSNRVTAASTTGLLRWAYRNSAIASEYVAQLSIGGVDGTLRKRFRSEKTRRAVRAKTGTLDDAIALSGYVTGPAGKGVIAFSILINQVAGHASAARIAADKLTMAIVKELYGEN